uniref:Uncharacterized protein n=1 Tax=Rhizophora mucronata TaxID=61149 RepID=A0A2P2QHJ0_RHIMU
MLPPIVPCFRILTGTDVFGIVISILVN